MKSATTLAALITATTLAGSLMVPAHAASLQAAAQATSPAGAAPSTVEQDASMQEKVKQALMSEPSLRGARIAISTRDGSVTLAGVVLSEDQRHRAHQLVAAINGVRRVDNTLEVQPVN